MKGPLIWTAIITLLLSSSSTELSLFLPLSDSNKYSNYSMTCVSSINTYVKYVVFLEFFLIRVRYLPAKYLKSQDNCNHIIFSKMKKCILFVLVLLTIVYLEAIQEYRFAFFEAVTEINGSVTVYTAKSLLDCSSRYLKFSQVFYYVHNNKIRHIDQ